MIAVKKKKMAREKDVSNAITARKIKIKFTLVTFNILPQQGASAVIRFVVIVFFWGPLVLVLAV